VCDLPLAWRQAGGGVVVEAGQLPHAAPHHQRPLAAAALQVPREKTTAAPCQIWTWISWDTKLFDYVEADMNLK
jgi:hypothetical protein